MAGIATPNETGGYEYKFIYDPPDDLVCKICFHPCRNPYLSGCCGHNFCKTCLDGARRAATNCPFCRSEEEFVTLANKLSDRKIRSLHVMCTNKERGCEWQGELNHINNHLGNSDGCQFEDVKCSNECGKMLQRRYLIGHVETECPHRKVDCQYCHITGEHQFIEGEHKEQCPKLPLPCPNMCEVGCVPREDMEAHRKECPLEMVQCEYHNVGCVEKMMRKDLDRHNKEKMEQHLSLTKLQLDISNKQINTLMIILHEIALAQGHTNSAASIVSVADWSVKLTTMATLIKSGDQVCPVLMSVTEFSKKIDQEQWYSDSFYSHDMGYKMCLCIYPAGFGSKVKGTYLSVFLYLMKGPHDDKPTCIWPLRGKFEVKLLNQISDCKHHSVTATYDYNTSRSADGRVIDGDKAKSGRGKTTFISNKDLHKVTPTCQYLKDDCIFFQVSKL